MLLVGIVDAFQRVDALGPVGGAQLGGRLALAICFKKVSRASGKLDASFFMICTAEDGFAVIFRGKLRIAQHAHGSRFLIIRTRRGTGISARC